MMVGYSVVHSAALLLAAITLFAVGVAGLNDNPCTSSWNAGQTYEWKDIDCSESSLIDWAIKKGPPLFLPAVLGLCVFLACPFFACGRFVCQCCGASRPRPGEGCCGGEYWDDKPEDEKLAAYSHGEVNATKYAALGILVLPLGYVLLCLTGASRLIAAVDDVTSGAEGLINWVLDDAERIANALAPDGNYTAEMRSFQTEYAKVRQDANEITRDFIHSQIKDEFVGLAAGLGYPSLIPAAFMVIGSLMAVLKIRAVVPMLCVFACFFLALPFGAASSGFFIVHTPIDLVCTEIDAQLSRSPGIFQNFLVPHCDDVNPIVILNDTLRGVERDASAEGCNELYRTCDNTTVYQSGSDVLWSCARLSACSTVGDVRLVMNSMRLKPGAPNPCSTSSTCTLNECAEQCSGTTRDQIRATKDAVDAADRVFAAFRASQLLERWAQCNSFFDHIITELGFCRNLPSGVVMLAFGFLLVVVGGIAGIVVFTMGSKRFFDRTMYDGGNAAFGGLAPVSMNAGTIVTHGGGGVQSPTHYHQAPDTSVGPDESLGYSKRDEEMKML